MSDEDESVTIYVYLLGEGIDVWTPVQAVPLGDGIYEIVSDNSSVVDEDWEFQKGDKVFCEWQYKDGGIGKPGWLLIALHRVDQQ